MATYQFDIAISFAGEDRSIAEQIVTKLKLHGVAVFYDKFEEATLFGEDLYEHLHDIYRNKARFCVMLLSKHYAQKLWTNHERKSAQERAFREREAYILSVRLDATQIPGIRETVGYFNLADRSVDDLIQVLLQKFGRQQDSKVSPFEPVPFAIPLPRTTTSITDRDKDKFLTESFQTVVAYFKEGIKQLNTVKNIEADFHTVTTQKFMCKVYQYGEAVNECTIWIGGQFYGNAINYRNVAKADISNSINAALTVQLGKSGHTLRPLLNVFTA